MLMVRCNADVTKNLRSYSNQMDRGGGFALLAVRVKALYASMSRDFA